MGVFVGFCLVWVLFWFGVCLGVAFCLCWEDWSGVWWFVVGVAVVLLLVVGWMLLILVCLTVFCLRFSVVWVDLDFDKLDVGLVCYNMVWVGLVSCLGFVYGSILAVLGFGCFDWLGGLQRGFVFGVRFVGVSVAWWWVLGISGFGFVVVGFLFGSRWCYVPAVVFVLVFYWWLWVGPELGFVTFSGIFRWIWICCRFGLGGLV